MKSTTFAKTALHTAIVLFGGFLVLAIAWLAYVGIYAAVESLFYANAPQMLPAGGLRMTAVILFFLAYVAVFMTRLPELAKAALLVAPLAVVIITIALGLYTNLLLMVSAVAIVAGGFIVVSLRLRKPWYYRLAIVYAVVLSLLYAIPR